MLQLNISQQYTKLDYTIQKPKLSLQSTQPQIQIETTPAKVEIHQPQGQLEIDQTPCRYSIGLKNNQDFTRDNAEEGMRTALETIGRIAEEGDRLARIESKEDAIANIAEESNHREPAEIAWVSTQPPIIHYQANTPEFNATAGKVDVNLQRGTVQGDFQWGKVDIQIAQYPSIKMWTVDVKV